MNRPIFLIILATWVAATPLSVKAIAAAEPSTGAGNSETGTIEGVVIYESDRRRPWRYRRNYVRNRKAGLLAEAVVCIEGLQTPKVPEAQVKAKAVLDQKDYNFIPETQAVLAGTVVTFTNSDPFRHDVTAKNTRQRFRVELRLGDKIPRILDQPGGIDDPLALTCAYHSAMRGWIYVFKHPYFAMTDEKGTFRIENVPPGQHKLVVVHPAGELRSEQVVDVKAGETTQIEIRLSPDHLIPREQPQQP